MKILTCNIRTSHANAKDGKNAWPRRKDLCLSVVKGQDADIVCFQEMNEDQFRDITEGLPGFRSYGMADRADSRRPVNSIFWLADAFDLVSAGGYWLSEQPHVPGSKSWDSACVRLANWVRLTEHATGAEFRVVNTHLDHVSQAAQLKQAELIVEDAAAYPDGYPQLLTGDMNVDATYPALAAFRAGGWADTYAQSHGTDDPGYTYHAFAGTAFDPQTHRPFEGKPPLGKMDWILMRGAWTVAEAAVLKDHDHGRYPSDHYFVSATLQAGR